MSSLRSALLAALAAAALGSAPAALAQDTTQQGVRIGLTYAPGTRPGLLVLPVSGEGGDSVRAILQRDFDFSDRLTVVASEGDGFPTTPVAGRSGNYPVYARLGAAAIVQVTMTPYGIHVALHDVAKGQVARVRDFGLPSPALTPDWRLALHAVSDELESWVTGSRGIAATRVTYVSGGRIWVIDSDGAGASAVTEGGIVMSPTWSPKGTHIAYAALRGISWHIGIRELGGATRWLATTPGGLNSTPVFSPDGNVIVYAHGEENGTDLYATSAFDTGPARRITVGRGSENTSPTFSPDGRRIAFTSGRAGHPAVYISAADGTNAELLTTYSFGDQSYRSNPDWAPDGRLIAYQSQIAGRFQLETTSLRDRSVKRLTSEATNEDPSWAPDSRHLVFASTRGGSKQLWVLDVESGRVRQLTRTAGARLAAWSPTLRRP